MNEATELRTFRAVVAITRHYAVVVTAPSILAAEATIEGMPVAQIEGMPPAGPKHDPRQVSINVERFDLIPAPRIEDLQPAPVTVAELRAALVSANVNAKAAVSVMERKAFKARAAGIRAQIAALEAGR